MTSRLKVSLAVASLGFLLAAPCGPAGATGTLVIKQKDGHLKTYYHVRIAVGYEGMMLTSRDGEGRLIVGKAGCTAVGALIRCLPYDATLLQHGDTTHIVLQSGTVWFNPTKTAQDIENTSTQLPSRGIMASLHTKVGTYAQLNGVVDEVDKK